MLTGPNLRRVIEDGQSRFRSLLAHLTARDRAWEDFPATVDPEVTASAIATYGARVQPGAVTPA